MRLTSRGPAAVVGRARRLAVTSRLSGNRARQLLFALLTVTLCATTTTADDKLYKWVDEDGNVTYQDQPPADGTGDTESVDDGESAPAAGLPDVAIVLYSSGDCAECDSVRQLLLSRGIPFTEKLIDGDPALEAELRDLAGVRSVPALAIGDDVILGHNEELILTRLGEVGFPAALLKAPGMRTDAAPPEGSQHLTREDLEQMTPEEIQQAARDAALRGEDNDLFEEDEGFLTLNKDVFPDSGPSGKRGEDINDLEGSTGDRRRAVEP